MFATAISFYLHYTCDRANDRGRLFEKKSVALGRDQQLFPPEIICTSCSKVVQRKSFSIGYQNIYLTFTDWYTHRSRVIINSIHLKEKALLYSAISLNKHCVIPVKEIFFPQPSTSVGSCEVSSGGSGRESNRDPSESLSGTRKQLILEATDSKEEMSFQHAWETQSSSMAVVPAPQVQDCQTSFKINFNLNARIFRTALLWECSRKLTRSSKNREGPKLRNMSPLPKRWGENPFLFFHGFSFLVSLTSEKNCIL